MNDLVAVKRVNKRGYTVTKWVKPDNVSTAGSAMPSPHALGSQTRIRLISKLANSIGRAGVNGDDDDIETIREELLRMEDRTLTVFREAIEKERDLVFTLSFAIREYTERESREIAFFSSSFNEDADCQERSELLNGLHSYTAFEGIDDMTTLDEAKYELASAMLRVGYRLYYGESHTAPATTRLPHGPRFITDHEWVGLVESNLDRVDEIVDLIRARGAVDVETTRSYLANGTALRDGVL
jgi:hypothetical protein